MRHHSGSVRASWLLCLGMVFCLPIAAHPQDAAVPTITFTLDFPSSEPEHYSISISSDGHATYESMPKPSPDSVVSDPFRMERMEFTVSPPTCTRIFDLAKRAHYFQGDLDSRKKDIAFTGKKILAYRDAQRNNEATYNYSPVPAVQELTQLFQDLSATLEFGRRLEYYHHYQKLALDDELKRMEEMAKQNSLAELSAVAPILQQIAADTSVINVVRARAQRMLSRAGLPVSP